MTLAQRITQIWPQRRYSRESVLSRSNREVPVKVGNCSFYAGSSLYRANARISGDDLTDESGFAVVNRLGGMSEKLAQVQLRHHGDWRVCRMSELA